MFDHRNLINRYRKTRVKKRVDVTIKFVLAQIMLSNFKDSQTEGKKKFQVHVS